MHKKLTVLFVLLFCSLPLYAAQPTNQTTATAKAPCPCGCKTLKSKCHMAECAKVSVKVRSRTHDGYALARNGEFNSYCGTQLLIGIHGTEAEALADVEARCKPRLTAGGPGLVADVMPCPGMTGQNYGCCAYWPLKYCGCGCMKNSPCSAVKRAQCPLHPPHG